MEDPKVGPTVMSVNFFYVYFSCYCFLPPQWIPCWFWSVVDSEIDWFDFFKYRFVFGSFYMHLAEQRKIAPSEQTGKKKPRKNKNVWFRAVVNQGQGSVWNSSKSNSVQLLPTGPSVVLY